MLLFLSRLAANSARGSIESIIDEIDGKGTINWESINKAKNYGLPNGEWYEKGNHLFNTKIHNSYPAGMRELFGTVPKKADREFIKHARSDFEYLLPFTESDIVLQLSPSSYAKLKAIADQQNKPVSLMFGDALVAMVTKK